MLRFTKEKRKYQRGATAPFAPFAPFASTETPKHRNTGTPEHRNTGTPSAKPYRFFFPFATFRLAAIANW
jgi:hypothetical protein